jgi:8-oxo-dGTP pyrophosphatase MutT (NUDIX family)
MSRDAETADDTRRIYSGKVIQLDVSRVTLPNGVVTDLELVRHPGGSAVVALDELGAVCLLRQYRHAVKGWMWELPAGKIDNQEPPRETARRELADEAGLSAREWHSLGQIVSSPGVLCEVIHLWLARDLTTVAKAPEPDEMLEVHWLPWEVAWSMAVDGKIRDAKTLAGLLRAQPFWDAVDKGRLAAGQTITTAEES